MIPIVEDIIDDMVTSQLDIIKETPDIIDELFISDSITNSLKTYIANNKVKVIKNYPREPAMLPCFCILLNSENEEPEALADFLDESYEDIEDNIEYVEEEAVVERAPYNGVMTTYIQVDYRPVSDVIGITDENQNRVDYAILNPMLGIITVDSEPGKLLSITYGHYINVQDTVGTLLRANFRVECWSDNVDLTVYMYYLLKYIVISNRIELTKKGLIHPVFTGGDLEPLPNYMPTYVYRRALSLSCKVENTVKTLLDLVQEIEVSNS